MPVNGLGAWLLLRRCGELGLRIQGARPVRLSQGAKRASSVGGRILIRRCEVGVVVGVRAFGGSLGTTRRRIKMRPPRAGFGAVFGSCGGFGPSMLGFAALSAKLQPRAGWALLEGGLWTRLFYSHGSISGMASDTLALQRMGERGGASRCVLEERGAALLIWEGAAPEALLLGNESKSGRPERGPPKSGRPAKFSGFASGLGPVTLGFAALSGNLRGRVDRSA